MTLNLAASVCFIVCAGGTPDGFCGSLKSAKAHAKDLRAMGFESAQIIPCMLHQSDALFEALTDWADRNPHAEKVSAKAITKAFAFVESLQA